MTAIAKPLTAHFRLPRWVFPRLSRTERQRRQTTIDLIHASPHLLRDIGATEEHFSQRGR